MKWVNRGGYLWVITARIKQENVDRAPGTDSVDGGDSGTLMNTWSCPPGCCPHPPTLVSGILGRRQCQSAGSAGLATDLQSTQAVKAARLPAGRAGRGASQLFA